ncbi:MAG: hypothetical protein EBR82_81590 [Caulobacteraceae bacterium]|nr:hypothetical protein [Caulobacteraceae bacterium]
MAKARGTLSNKEAVAAAEFDPVTPETAYPKDIYAMMSPAQRKEAMTPNIVRRAVPVEEPVRRAEPVPQDSVLTPVAPPDAQYGKAFLKTYEGDKRAQIPGIRDYLDEVTSEENKNTDFSNQIKEYYSANPGFGDELYQRLDKTQAPAWDKFWTKLSSGDRAGAIVSANTSISAKSNIPESFFVNALQRDRMIREAQRQDMEK